MYQTKTVGNDRVRQILDEYIDTIVQTGHIPVPFLLLQGPSWLGKMNVAYTAAEKLLWIYMKQDSVVLEDRSLELEKPHTIKISSDEEITRADGSLYVDMGIREVHQRMVRSPVGQRKALLIEDIERLTDSAANALLKILEEPLPWRIIIATTSQVGGVLPTILSRALLFSFYPTNDNGIDDYIQQTEWLQWYDREFLYAIATGRPGVLDELLQNPDHLILLQTAFHAVTSVNASAKKLPSMTETYTTLTPLIKAGIEKIFLQAYIYYAAKRHQWNYVTLAQETFVLCDYAINTEHILFDFVSRLYVTSWA